MLALLLTLLLSPTHPLPEPPAVLARERADAVQTLKINGEPMPLSPDAAMTLDGKDVTAAAFFAGLKTVTEIEVRDGWIIRLSGTSK